jgi:ribosome assembly protein YihI (activator of Der GTPase)
MAENQNRDTYPNENLGQDNTSSNLNEEGRTGNKKKKNKGRKGSSEMATRQNTRSDGYGSSQSSEDTNVGPLDADLNELPSKRRTSGNNQTGSGLG